MSEADLESSAMRLNVGALALAFGVAGALEATLWVAVTGAMWVTMDGGGGSMHRLSGYGSMMGGGFGGLFYAVVCGFLGGALAGGVSAWIYNTAVSRDTRAQSR